MGLEGRIELFMEVWMTQLINRNNNFALFCNLRDCLNQWCAGKTGSVKKKPWFVTFIHLPGVNTSITVTFMASNGLTTALQNFWKFHNWIWRASCIDFRAPLHQFTGLLPDSPEELAVPCKEQMWTWLHYGLGSEKHVKESIEYHKKLTVFKFKNAN